jgi:hypothetical protein
MKSNIENGAKKPKRKRNETAKDKVHRHLTDKDDKITDEDLRDVVVGVKAMSDQQDEPTITEEDLPKKTVVTPWDVLEDQKD